MTDLGIEQVVTDVPSPTHDCRNGHPQVPENIYFHKQSGRYYCRICRRLREQGREVLNPRISAWNEATLDELRRGLAAHHSASWIAADIFRIHGWNVSRSAVCGKIFRLGLSNPMPKSQTRGQRKPRKPSAWRPPPRPMVVEPAPIVVDQDIPFEQRRGLLELDNHTCRWPCGMPGEAVFFFCGSLTADLSAGLPYCTSHTLRARA